MPIWWISEAFPDWIISPKKTVPPGIGAMVIQRAVECSPIVRQKAPALAQAVSHVGNIRIRQTASFGGNLAHGDYRLDPPPALLVLGTDLVLFGPQGYRTVPIKDFYREMYETALESGEILVEARSSPYLRGVKPST